MGGVCRRRTQRVDAYGCVDELNAALGLARATARDPLLTEQILREPKGAGERHGRAGDRLRKIWSVT